MTDLRTVHWWWHDRLRVCDMMFCPTSEGGYCIECHIVAWNALLRVRRHIVSVLCAV